MTCVSPYMATMPYNILSPNIYDGYNDLEQFIIECQRFFEVSQVNETIQALVMKAFINKDILSKYEAVDEKITNFAERLRKAFKKPSSLIHELQDIINYRKGLDIVNSYYNKV